MGTNLATKKFTDTNLFPRSYENGNKSNAQLRQCSHTAPQPPLLDGSTEGLEMTQDTEFVDFGRGGI